MKRNHTNRRNVRIAGSIKNKIKPMPLPMKISASVEERLEEFKLDVLPSLLDDAKEHLVSEFEDSLPEHLGKLETELREEYLEEILPEQMEELEVELKEQFMDEALPKELKKAEANLIDEHTKWLLEQEKEAIC